MILRRATVLLVSSAIAFVAWGCQTENPNYCPTHPEDLTCPGHDAGKQCTDNTQCLAPTAVCDKDITKICVQCTPTEAGACTGTKPTCTDNMCHACTAHNQCSSDACLPDGSCGDDTNTAYVDPQGPNNTMCTKQMPCVKVSAALATRRPFVKFTGTTNEQIAINNQDVTFLADPGAILTATTNGILLKIDGTSRVAVYDLTISGALGMNNPGISLQPGTAANVSLVRAKVTNNAGVGILVNDGSLSVSQSAISGNQAGGILISNATTFDIENNFIMNNGKATDPMSSPQGGVAIVPNIAGAKLTFNTIAFNKDNGALYRGGVTCLGIDVAAQGNIVYGNTEGQTTGPATQSAGGCKFGNSLSLASSPGDLGFKNPTLPDMDLHLTATSPATVVNAGGPCTGVDFDGDMRPIGSACDLGADEYHP